MLTKLIKPFFSRRVFPIVLLLLIGLSAISFASEGGTAQAGHNPAQTFLWIAVLLVIAKLSGLVEKVGQPSVLGELIAGVILGNLFLLGIPAFEAIKTNEIIRFLAELGVVVLLFQIGLESNIHKIKKVGLAAFLVAIIGVAAPFLAGTFFIGPLLLPGLDTNAYLFLGAALTATSVGITARVLKDLNKLHTKESQIILGAAVIDDVLGLIILAVVSALATTGAVSIASISIISLKSIAFLVGAILLGQYAAEYLGKIFSKIHTGAGMKFTLAICFGLFFAFLADQIGLAAIVGAFAAGLVLDSVHFRFFRSPKIIEELELEAASMTDEQKVNITKIIGDHSEKHIEDLIEPISFLLVPLFFVITGMDVNLSVLSSVSVIITSLIITILAIITKIIAGFAAGKNTNKWIVGFGMVPRGEVGLIFATIGRSINVISEEVFSIIVVVVILSTLITPPVLASLLKRQDKRDNLSQPTT